MPCKRAVPSHIAWQCLLEKMNLSKYIVTMLNSTFASEPQHVLKSFFGSTRVGCQYTLCLDTPSICCKSLVLMQVQYYTMACHRFLHVGIGLRHLFAPAHNVHVCCCKCSFDSKTAHDTVICLRGGVVPKVSGGPQSVLAHTIMVFTLQEASVSKQALGDTPTEPKLTE